MTLASTTDDTDTGCCSDVMPIVPQDIAPIIMVLDIFLPGIGTCLAAYYYPDGCNCKTMTCGVF